MKEEIKNKIKEIEENLNSGEYDYHYSRKKRAEELLKILEDLLEAFEL